jgi:ubiquinone/menaquinone biosynthesis C-methylase UbiE
VGKIGKEPADKQVIFNQGRGFIMGQQGVKIDDHVQKVRDFHDRDAAGYHKERYHSRTCEGLAYLTRREIILAMAAIKPGRVLDLGCGPGILTKNLVDKGHTVYSADLSCEMIEKAREAASHASPGLFSHFVVSDASQIPFAGERMDMVFSIGLMCYIDNHKDVLKEIYRVLVPGGFAIIQINNIRWPIMYRMFVPLYHCLKSLIFGKNYDLINFEFNFSSRKRFLKDLEECNLRVVNLERYDFRVPFLDILLPRLSVNMGKLMFQNRNKPLLKCFSHGLLIKVQKLGL